MDVSAAAIVASTLQSQSLMEGWRGTFESHWEEIAPRVLPRDSGMFQGTRTPGEKKTQQLFDPTAALGAERFAAVMDSMITPRNGKWHRLRASDPALNRNARVRRYFGEVNDILFQYRYAPRANFASQKFEEYLSLGVYGTGGIFIDKRMPSAIDPRGGLGYRSIHLSELYFAENFEGLVDTVHRKFKLTARQAVQKFNQPNDKIPVKILEMVKSKPETEYTFIHCIKPRADVDPQRADYKGMPYASYYICVELKELIREGGYNTFPYAVSRYVTASREVYGRSPAMTVLPSIKVLNEQKKTSLKMGHRLADPIILGADDGVLDTFSLKPGSQVAGGIDSQGRKLVSTLDMPQGQLTAIDKLMQMEKDSINDAFLVTLFQILTDNPQMTATEVLERTREKGVLLAPTMGRQQSESLAPTIERELDLLAEMRFLPQMPPELIEAQGEYSLYYDSPLSRAMRAEEAAGFNRLVEQTAVVANATQDPSYFDHFDFDEAIPELADIQAVPPQWMASPEKLQAKRDARSQQASVQNMIEAGPSAAAMMKVAKDA
jgi:hypothetical protein